MGIARGTIKLLMEEGRRKPFQGAALTLGKQDIWVTEKELKEIAEEMRFALQPVSEFNLSEKKEMSDKGYISDVSLFLSLGFHSCKSIDASSYESADYIFDLNKNEPPHHLRESFDVIVDGGTLEHVFHLPNALSNVFKLLKIGGRIIHISPSSNHMDHGFYMFSPTLFWDYYECNKFELNRFLLIRHHPQSQLRWKIYNYNPGSINPISYGGLDHAMYAIGCIVTKTDLSTADAIPQQRNYLHGSWKSNPSLPKAITFVGHIKNWIKRNPRLYKSVAFLSNRFRFRSLKIKCVGRY